ncbi:MAG: hypothetical protein HY964_02375 [Ignavibacteriales bacterium]|nr:hypothetical protein [Ignavibacteriales bacterium]
MNIKSILYIISVIILALLNFGCDKGLSPIDESQGGGSVTKGISGTIHFINWPPESTLVDLRLVAFKNYPPGDIVAEVMQGNAQFTETLKPYFSDSLSYTLVLTSGAWSSIQYIVVAQQFGPNIQADWKMVGVYYSPGDSTKPGSINLPSDGIVNGINIKVNFLNPPSAP